MYHEIRRVPQNKQDESSLSTLSAAVMTGLALGALETSGMIMNCLLSRLFVSTERFLFFCFSALQNLICSTRTMAIMVTGFSPCLSLCFYNQTYIMSGWRALKGDALPRPPGFLKGRSWRGWSWPSHFHGPVIFFFSHSGFVFPTMCYYTSHSSIKPSLPS